MRGVVVAPQPLAAEIGAEFLERGGNAFDAAIGAAFVQMVTDPQMCGLGGYTLFDDHRSNLGHTAVGTPGVIAGLASLHDRARLPWAELIEPAAALARQGFPAPEFALEALRRLPLPGMPNGDQRARYTPDSASLWCRADGSLRQPGDHWANPALANTLERLARAGAPDFYTGELAERIAEELARGR